LIAERSAYGSSGKSKFGRRLRVVVFARFLSASLQGESSLNAPRWWIPHLVIAILGGLSFPVWGASPPVGARGYGLTVFSGEEPVRFDVEIVGVLEGFGGTGDMILARCSGGPLEQTGVLQGMSGSPVYVGGELIGAVMSTWPFATEPLAGIRPIAEMRAAAEGMDAAPPRDLAPAPGGNVGLSDGSGAGQSRSGLVWSASGFAPALLPTLSAGLGVELQAGAAASTGAKTTAPRPLSPGHALSVLLVDGDARLFATGTVTSVERDRVYAFGHPLLGLGPLQLPIARSRVVALMPSQEISFKMAAPLERVGALELDRRACIVGRLGADPDMLPLAVTISDAPGPSSRTYDFEIGRVPALLPSLVGWSVQNALLDRDQIAGEQTLRLELSIELKDRGTLRSRAALSGQQIAQDLAAELTLPLTLLQLNPDAELRLQRIAVRLNVESGRHVAQIGRVQLEDPRPEPGQPLRLAVEVLPRRENPRWVQLELKPLADLAPGRYRVHVGDGAQAFREELVRSAARWQQLGLRQIHDAFELRQPASDLVAVLYGPPRSVVVRGVELENLPATVRTVLARGHGAPEAESVAATPLARASLQTEWVLEGARYLTLEVPAAGNGANGEARAGNGRPSPR
jgi:hypothetical protein